MRKKKTEVTLLPAIADYYNKLKALLELDPDIKVTLYINDDIINVEAADSVKATAWRVLLPAIKTIGDKEIIINVESTSEDIDANILTLALKDNEAFSRLYHIEDPVPRDFCYMKPYIIQFPNDNFSSPESLETRTAEDLAKELLNIPGVGICSEEICRTESENDVYPRV